MIPIACAAVQHKTALFFGDCADAACSSGTMQMLDGDTTVSCALSSGDSCKPNNFISTYNNTAYDSISLFCPSSADCKVAFFSGSQPVDWLPRA